MSQEFGFRSNVGGPSDLSLGVYTGYQAKRSTVKNDPHTVCYLKQQRNSYLFKIYQKQLFLSRETKKLKIAVFPIIYTCI